VPRPRPMAAGEGAAVEENGPGPSQPNVSDVLSGPPAAAEPSAPQTAREAIVIVPPGPDGGDPLVRRYLDRFRATCAFHTLSFAWIAIGLGVAIIGAWIGSRTIGQLNRAPFTDSQLVLWMHHHFGNPWGVVAGIAIAAAITALVSAILGRRRASGAQEVWAGAVVVVLAYLLLFDRVVFASVTTGVLCVIYIAAIGFRIVALAAGGRLGLRSDALDAPEGGWPLYTVLVPLYKERNVARNILASLAKLDYPRDRLDVKFLLETDDPDTLSAIKTAGIPAWAEVVIVPPAQPKTKPRACNHGLERARGDLLVVFDAEDRPEPDQLKQAVIAFARVKDSVACLQAQLAYHNHDQNLLTRWFALEYNVWFRQYLAGLERLGVPIPLGGTSNHFRTAALRQLGGWDPFNVTEDCDLGVRLRIAGYRTRILASTTWEEANSRVGNWLRQRSRWLKGYLVTHLVWCRRPLHLVVALGPWATLGFLLSVFCVSALAALNLVLWAVTALYATLLTIDVVGKGHDLWKLLSVRPEFYAGDRLSWPMVFFDRGEDPLWSTLSQVFFAASLCLLAGNLAFVLINAIAGRRPGQKGLWWAALLSPAYWVLISLAAWKGLWQLLVKPHYWEKTVHGLDHAPEAGESKAEG